MSELAVTNSLWALCKYCFNSAASFSWAFPKYPVQSLDLFGEFNFDPDWHVVGTAIAIDWNRTCEGKSGSRGLEYVGIHTQLCLRRFQIWHSQSPLQGLRTASCSRKFCVCDFQALLQLSFQLPVGVTWATHLQIQAMQYRKSQTPLVSRLQFFSQKKRYEFPGIVESWFLKVIPPATNASSHNLLWPCQARIEGHPSDPATAPAHIQHRDGWHLIKQSQLYTM